MSRSRATSNTTWLALDSGDQMRTVKFRERVPDRQISKPWALLFGAIVLGFMLLSSAGFPGGHGGAGLGAVHAANPTDQIIVQFKTSASEQAVAALNSSMATQQVDAIPALGLRVLRVPASQTASAMAARYARNPLVQFAEVNALVKPEAVPNDPNYGSAWHLPKIQAPSAWDSANATGVLIGICDTGVASVADLVPVLRADLGWNAVDNTANWGALAGHGTMVAGAAAAATNNQLGVSGVAWGARIIPVRISNLTDGSAYVSDAVKCINYAADNGARVINLSYRMAGSVSIDTAGKYAAGKGAVTVVAAGNDGIDPGWQNYSGFLAVGGTNNLDQKASWSNVGSFIDISAPGVSIMTTMASGSYGTASGTSLASPVVTGVLALVFGAKPGLSAAEAQSIVLNSADDIGAAGWESSFGWGRVNASRAVAAALGATSALSPTPTASPSATVAPSPSPTATPVPGGDSVAPSVSITTPADGQTLKGNLKLNVSASDNVGVTKVEIYVDGKLSKTLTAAPYSAQMNTRQWTNGVHQIVARAYDAAGNQSEDVHSVNVAN